MLTIRSQDPEPYAASYDAAFASSGVALAVADPAVPAEVVHGAAVAAGGERGTLACDHLWFALVRQPWATLAVVPAQPGGSALAAAQALAAAGRAYQHEPVYVVDAAGAQPAQVGALLRTAADLAASGARVLVATASPLGDASAIPVARGVDAAVLAVQLGHAEGAAARRAVDAVGVAHFVGAFTVEG